MYTEHLTAAWSVSLYVMHIASHHLNWCSFGHGAVTSCSVKCDALLFLVLIVRMCSMMLHCECGAGLELLMNMPTFNNLNLS